MFLDATTRTLKVKIEAGHTTNAPEFAIGYADIINNVTGLTPGQQLGVFNGSTLVTALAAPSSAVQRQIKTISYYNKDSVTHTFTTVYDDNGTQYILSAVSVAAGKTLVWTYERGWQIQPVTVLSTTDVGEGSNLYFTNERVDDRVAALLIAGTNITLTYNDPADTLTIDASGGGGGSDITADWMDTPANPGWDPNFSGALQSAVTLSNSNKRLTPASGGPFNHAAGTPGRSTGKYYFEMVPGATGFTVFGVCSGPGRAAHFPGSNDFGKQLGQLGWANNGTVSAMAQQGTSGGYVVATIQTWTTADRLSFAVDMDLQLIWFRTNAGNWNNSGGADPATGTGGIALSHVFNGASTALVWPGGSMGNTNAHDMFLLTADFTQSVPSGFTDWGA